MLSQQVDFSVELANKLLAEQAALKNGTVEASAPAPEPAPPSEPTTPPATNEPAPPAVELAAPPPPSNWEAQFKLEKQRNDTLQGMIRKVQSDGQARVAAMETDIVVLKAKLAEKQTAPPVTVAPSASDADVEAAYGKDMVALLNQRVAAEVGKAQGVFDQRLAQFEQQLGQVQQVSSQTVNQSLEARLTEAVPNWRQVDQDPLWLDWLGKADPFSGVIRQDILDKAYQGGDIARCKVLFDAFGQSIALPASSIQSPVVAVAPPVSPRTMGSPTPTAAPSVQVTRAFIADHYARAARDPAYTVSAEYKTNEQIIHTAVGLGKVN